MLLGTVEVGGTKLGSDQDILHWPWSKEWQGDDDEQVCKYNVYPVLHTFHLPYYLTTVFSIKIGH